MTRVCVICGKEFEAVRPNQKCCCPECMNENRKMKCREYNRRHREEIKVKRMIWYEENREHVLEYARNYYHTHKQERNERDRRYYRENREAILEKRKYDRTVKPKMEACREKHNWCFDCPTNGECLYE